jgi:hypothetical protein
MFCLLPSGQVLDGEFPKGGVFDGKWALTDLISYRIHAEEDSLTTEHLKEEEEEISQSNKGLLNMLKLVRE